MDASALPAPRLARRPLSSPLLRLRSDEQLVALFRDGHEEAFAVMHDRYRQRLFAYVRQMLARHSRADAEDVLQDVFVRAYGALRADGRDINLRAWLYRVAHNRCIDHLRRPSPPAGEVFDVSRTPLQDPIETAQRRDDLKRLVDDVGRLPEQQRSALLMREIDGLAYADIAAALDVTVPAVKSLLVRARIGLVEAAEARDTDCAVIRGDLTSAYDRGVKASGRARRHMRECEGCRDYRTALRGMRRSFAALSPVAGLGPLALIVKAVSGGAAVGGGASAGAGAGAGAATAGLASLTAGKVAAVMATAVVATGGAAEVKRIAMQPDAVRHVAPAPARAAGTPAAAGPPAAAPAAPAAVSPATIRRRTDLVAAAPAAARPVRRAHTRGSAGTEAPAPAGADAPVPASPTAPIAGPGTGGATAPAETPPAPPVKPVPGSSSGPTAPASGTGDSTEPAGGGTASPAGEAPPADPATTAPVPPPPAASGPPPEH